MSSQRSSARIPNPHTETSVQKPDPGEAKVLSKSGSVRGARTLPWLGLVVILLVASQAFGAGATRVLGYSEGAHDQSAVPLSETADEQPSMNQLCWPIVFGGDTQCIETP
jgi:hypothetical protein